MNHPHTLSSFVQETLETYLAQETSEQLSDLHNTILSAVEKPLLETILSHTQGNQTLSAKILGISRTTLRTKIKEYNI